MMFDDAGTNPQVGDARGAQRNSNLVNAPSISLPKGGGAIRGIGEKFGANPVNGTGSMTVPIATSPGRSGFGPRLSLCYNSSAGNGPFGLGWSLSPPSITRKTDRGIPQYRDGDKSDVFILSGSEDLVPVLEPDGTRFVDEVSAPGFTIHRYRPRVEGLFARIERWTRRADGDTHWRSLSKDNVATVYGRAVDRSVAAHPEIADPRLSDPSEPKHVFSWLICETRDDKGNAILYEYKNEDGAGIDTTRARERNRGDGNDPRRKTNRYLKRIRYGNRATLLDASGMRPRFLTDAQMQHADWMFEVVFDYGEHDADAPKPNELGPMELPTGPILQLPLRVRGAHYTTLPARADVPPLRGSGGRRQRLPRALH